MNLNRIKTTMATGMLAASMILPGMTAYAVDAVPGKGVGASATTTTPAINKTVKAADGVTLPQTDVIKFTATQYDHDGPAIGKQNSDGTTQPLDTIAPTDFTINVSALTAIENSTNLAGTAAIGTTFTSKLTKNGEYTFTLEESDELDKGTDKYGWTINDTTLYLHVYVSDEVDATGAKTGSKVYEWLVTATDELGDTVTKLGALDYENTFTKRAGSSEVPVEPGTDPDDPNYNYPSLTVKKTVDGNSAKYENEDTEYEFTITFTGDGDTAVVDTNGYAYQVYKDGSAVSGTGKSGTLKSGDTVSLKNGEEVRFSDIQAGIKVNVEETGTLTNIQKTEVTVVSDGNTVTPADGDQKTKAGTFLLGEGTNKAEYTNTYSDITVTGVVTDIAPYVTLIAVAVAAIAAYMGLKSRIAR